jgi:hypothetical protein
MYGIQKDVLGKLSELSSTRGDGWFFVSASMHLEVL